MLESEIKKLTAAVEANTAALSGRDTPVAADAKPAQADASPVAAAEAAAAPAATIDIPLDVPAETVTLKQITEGIVRLCREVNREAAAILMAEYGATKVPELKKVSDKYPEILDKINALIKAAPKS